MESTVPDVVDSVGETRTASSDDVSLPRGLYWFSQINEPLVMIVGAGAPSGDGHALVAPSVEDGDPLADAYDWAEYLWESGIRVPAPRFTVGEDVVTVPGGQDSVVRARRFIRGSWSYEIRLAGRTQQVLENNLDFLPDGGDPADWTRDSPAPVSRFGATLTRGKLEGHLTDTVFSFRATRTVFRPYQFKPVLKLLQTGATRILVADEVGLGKTIEAGLIWTEFEARKAADRVLVVCPSSLVGKWQEEMEERFGFELTELAGDALERFLRRHLQGSLTGRYAYVASLEKLRTWSGLADLAELPPQFDLLIVDEAHAMRNTDTKSHALGEQLGEWADARVFLTATPVNLGSKDLANMLELLAPEDFDDAEVLELRLAPNAVLHAVERSLVEPTATRESRLVALDSLDDHVFGLALKSRPDYVLLRDVLSRDPLRHADIVEARKHLSELNALSSVVTRTRKVEVDEHKALRRPLMVEVQWTPAESDFYAEYVKWCVARADAVNMPLHFAMQMPLRLASASLPAARASVLGSAGDWRPLDEDSPDDTTPLVDVPPHPELVHAAEALSLEVDSKFDRLLPIVHQLVCDGRQALLFTFSRPTLAYLARRLDRHARVAVLHGGVKRADRRRVMADFRAGKYDILLANRVASEGLDFEFCSAVINYDLPWNPMEVEQRIGRIDRIGQVEEKILVVNFYNDESIDERILRRVLERIGVFERAIGALEPIIQTHLPDLKEAALNFKLTDAERRAKADQILTAIEAKRVSAEELAGAASDLLVSDDVDIAGLETELVRAGRYVGQHELAQLLQDWATTANAPGIDVFPDRRRMRLRGNAEMAGGLQQVAQRGDRTQAELGDWSRALLNEDDIHLVLDQEDARTSGGSLLTANHPLVRAALAVPGHRQARYAHVRVRDDSARAEPGSYVALLGLARGGGERPTREIWGAAVDMGGTPASQSVTDVLLAGLAQGALEHSLSSPQPEDVADLLGVAEDQLRTRHVLEQQRREQEAAAAVESRRLSLESQLERKLRSIDRRLETSRNRGRGNLHLLESQRRRAFERHEQLLADLSEKRESELVLGWLAACYMEIYR
jgi:superfamily II DNA or RNA helicase